MKEKSGSYTLLYASVALLALLSILIVWVHNIKPQSKPKQEQIVANTSWGWGTMLRKPVPIVSAGESCRNSDCVGLMQVEVLLGPSEMVAYLPRCPGDVFDWKAGDRVYIATVESPGWGSSKFGASPATVFIVIDHHYKKK